MGRRPHPAFGAALTALSIPSFLHSAFCSRYESVQPFLGSLQFSGDRPSALFVEEGGQRVQVTFPEGVTLSPTTEEKGTGEHRLGQEKGPWGRGLTEPEGPQVLWHRPRVHTPFLGGLRKEADAHLKLATGPDRTEPAPPSRGSRPPPRAPSAQHHGTQNWGHNSHRTAGPTVPTGYSGRSGHGWPHTDSPVRRQTLPHATHGTLGWVICPGWEGKGRGPSLRLATGPGLQLP